MLVRASMILREGGSTIPGDDTESIPGDNDNESIPGDGAPATPREEAQAAPGLLW